MDQVTDQPARDGNGRFAPGCSGNPKGKAPGTRNRATVLRALMRDGDEDAIGRVLIDRALGGDPVAARFLIDGLNPKPRQRTITLDLPDGADAAAIFLAAAGAMVAGEISPDEARAVMRFVAEGQRTVQAARDMARANAARRTVDAVRAVMVAAASEAAEPPAPETPVRETAPASEPIAASAAASVAAPTRHRAAALLHSACKSTIIDGAPGRSPVADSVTRLDDPKNRRQAQISSPKPVSAQVIDSARRRASRTPISWRSPAAVVLS